MARVGSRETRASFKLNHKPFNGWQRSRPFPFEITQNSEAHKKCQLHDSERKKFIGSQSFRARLRAFLRLSSVMKII